MLLQCQVALRANVLSALVRAERRIGYDRARSKDLHGLFVRENWIFARFSRSKFGGAWSVQATSTAARDRPSVGRHKPARDMLPPAPGSGP